MNPNLISDFDSDSTTNSIEPSHASVLSFWTACAGLAIFAYLSTMGASQVLISSRDWIEHWIFINLNYPQFVGLRYAPIIALTQLLGTALMPSLVISCVIPILYWRGHLGQRFVISIMIAVTVLSIVSQINFQFWNHMTASWIVMTKVAACWIALPILFRYTPIKKNPLRLTVASGILLLMLCLSIAEMKSEPYNGDVFGAMSLYAAVFCFALLRRDWGRIAMCEAGTNASDIQITSTRTLMELMVVSGLACSAVSLWKSRLDFSAAILFASVAAFGWMMTIISMTLIRFAFEPGTYRILKTILLGTLVAIAFYCIAMQPFMLPQVGIPFTAVFRFVDFSITIICASIASSFLYILLTLGIGYWLRWCSWRMERVYTSRPDGLHQAAPALETATATS